MRADRFMVFRLVPLVVAGGPGERECWRSRVQSSGPQVGDAGPVARDPHPQGQGRTVQRTGSGIRSDSPSIRRDVRLVASMTTSSGM